MRVLLAVWAIAAFAQTPPRSLHPDLRKIASEVSEDRIAAIMRKLASFPSRHIEAPAHEEARAWIEAEFKSYGPRLQVRSDRWVVEKMARTSGPMTLANVVAVLPGKTEPETQILVSGHYDTISLTAGQPQAARPSPGAADDASGTAATMELARVLSRYEFDKTLVFVAFDSEEQGLYGARLHAQTAKANKTAIEAVLNNDIIGSDLSGNGFRSTHAVRVFSDEPMDGPSRSLARYVKETGERYLPGLRVDLVFRRDRFGRGGDHTAFHDRGYAAVRFTTPAEHLSNQHSAKDTFENSSPSYTARVARLNAVSAAALAWAPKPPVLKPLQRGSSQYDAVLRWDATPRAAGYIVRLRATTAPYWEREWALSGDVREFVLSDVSIDDIVLGVQAFDSRGIESLVTPYALRDRNVSDVDAKPVQ